MCIRIFKGLVAVAVLMMLLDGCETGTVFIQNLNTEGMFPDAPVHLGEKQSPGSVRIIAQGNYNPLTSFDARIDDHTPLNAQGKFQVDTSYNNGKPSYSVQKDENEYPFLGKNFHAEYPQSFFSADVDYAESEHLSILLGGQYAVMNREQFTTGYIGVGYTLAGENNALRFDYGWRFSAAKFYVDDVREITPGELFMYDPNPTSSVDFGSRTGVEHHSNYYASLTLNTNAPNRTIDFFVRLGITQQTVLDESFYLNDSYDAEHAVSIGSFSPGIIFNLAPSMRVLSGIIFAHDFNTYDATPFPVQPFVQVDFRF